MSDFEDEDTRPGDPGPQPGLGAVQTTTEDLPPAECEPVLPERVLEKAYFHINNGGLTLRISDKDGSSRDPSRRQYALRAEASHFGRGICVEVPLLSRSMVRWLAEASQRVSDYLEQHPEHKLSLLDDDKEEPRLEVVNSIRLPRRVVTHSYSSAGIAMSWTENTTAQVAEEVGAYKKDYTEQCQKDVGAHLGAAVPPEQLREQFCRRCRNPRCRQSTSSPADSPRPTRFVGL